MCLASIVMPIYNGEAHLSHAIESLLGQTFTDFKLIAVDDCSTDQSLSILRSYRDKRILIVKNERHIGISAALNQGLLHAEGKWIFRMDADDISFPQRIQCQVDFMESHPQMSICGSDTELIDQNGTVIGLRSTKKGDQCIKIALFLGETSIPHPTAVFRQSFIQEHRVRYSEHYPYAEDYELWCRCSTFGTYENLPQALLQYRHHDQSVSKAHYIRQRLTARRILANHLHRLGLDATSEELACHFQFSLKLLPDDSALAKERFDQWNTKLIRWNRDRRLFEPNLFEAELEHRRQKALRPWG